MSITYDDPVGDNCQVFNHPLYLELSPLYYSWAVYRSRSNSTLYFYK